MENPDFLKKKYDLHNSEEVKKAAERTERRTGKKVPQNPSEQIQNYLDRLKEIIDNKDPLKRERGMHALKRVLHDKFVIKPEEVPESYFENQKRIAREQGHGYIEISKEAREQLTEVIIADQRSTLDNWIDYLSSSDATYPDWLKYYAFRSVVGMGEYDKEKKAFAKRSKATTKPFPDINREALAYVLDAISQKYGKRHTDLLALGEEEKKEFEKLLQGENFPKLYAWALEKLTIAPSESLEKVAGKWVKYSHKSDHMPLVESLRGHGTGWCTAGDLTARIQLLGGDFYVYYSLDKNGKPTIPRAAIRMQGNKIGEVRGIAKDQNLDPYIGSVVKEKLKEFPDGAPYEKKVEDMKLLTVIENKVKNIQELNKDELVFLYEINTPIEGFGYYRDPRIEKLQFKRGPNNEINSKKDMLIVFECTPDQIAHTSSEINENTKAYVGKLEPGIFQKLPADIEHVYYSFPYEKIHKENLEIGGKNTEELIKELETSNIHISDDAKEMLKNRDFVTGKEREEITLIRLTIDSLGFRELGLRGVKTSQIYRRAEELGLEPCPPEAGPHYILKYKNRYPISSVGILIGMKQIGSFEIRNEREVDGRPLLDIDLGNTNMASPDYNPDYKTESDWDTSSGAEFVFRLRKAKT